eukprot:Hpha_TRINITY_DN1449_c0_g1::TRINITY_DN1449_c0_g1_i1::g.9606::m.9606
MGLDVPFNVPLAAAAGQAFLHLALGVRMTMFRSASFTDKAIVESGPFLKWHKAQTINQEYSGVLTALYGILYAATKGGERRTLTDIFCIAGVLSSFSFAIGVINGKHAEGNPTTMQEVHLCRMIGALGRYFALALGVFELVQIAK